MGAIDAQEAGWRFERESKALVLCARQWLDLPAAEDAVQDVFESLMLQSRPPEQMKARLGLPDQVSGPIPTRPPVRGQAPAKIGSNVYTDP